MTETWTQWLRSKFDTVLLLVLFAILLHMATMEYHEVLGALLLALTGTRNQSRQPDPPPGTTQQVTRTTTIQQQQPTVQSPDPNEPPVSAPPAPSSQAA